MARIHTRSHRIAFACLLATTAAGAFATPALAQAETTAATEAGNSGGDIVVTARRREETLVSVPIAITAISGDALANAGAADITAIADTVPNVTLEPSRGTNSTLSAFIRGVGQQDPVSGFEQGVGLYLDDVYLNRPQAAVLDIYDVERVEVLRGPQGTLYGRNTIGGAIKYVTKRLDDKAHLALRGTYGSYDQADGVITASTPVTSDGMLRIGGSLARLTRGGFGKNLTTGEDNYNKNIWAGRGTIELHGSSVFARLTADYTHDKSNARGGHRLIPGQLSGNPVLVNKYDTQGGLTSPAQDVKAWGTSLFIEARPSAEVTLRSITAYRKDDSSSPIDFDASAAVDVDVPAFYNNRQISQEAQILYDKGPLHAMTGFYYLHATAATQFDVRIFTTLNGLTAFTKADVRTDTLAGFANLTYDITDQLTFEAGGRYTWDKREAYILRQNYLGGGSPVFGGAGVAFGAPSTNFRGDATFRKFTPRVSLSWKPNPDHQLYASFSQGFKGGGFDPRGVGTSAPTTNASGIPSEAEVASFLTFRPEKVNSYEVGYKARLFDRRVNLSLAAFQMDYTDVQIPGSVACTTKVLVAGQIQQVPSFCGVVSNAGKARMRGFEAEASARLGPITLNGSLGYIDAKYLKYITNITVGGVPTPTDVAANRKVQNTPAWTGNASATYTLGTAQGAFALTGGVSWKSKTYQFELPNPFLDQPAYALLDASLVWHSNDRRWSLGVFGKNLANKRYKTAGYTFVGADPVTGTLLTRPNGTLIPTLGREGVLTAYYGDPRRVFATATLNF